MDLGWIWDGSGVDLGSGSGPIRDAVLVRFGIDSGPVRDPILARFGIRFLARFGPDSELIAEGRRSKHGSRDSRAVTPSGDILDPFFNLY